MKHIHHLFGIVAGTVLLAGCASSDPAAEKSKPERGRDGTIAYLVEVVSSEPGVKIEADGSYIGTTPLTLKIFGDKDGTFPQFWQPGIHSAGVSVASMANRADQGVSHGRVV